MRLLDRPVMRYGVQPAIAILVIAAGWLLHAEERRTVSVSFAISDGTLQKPLELVVTSESEAGVAPVHIPVNSVEQPLAISLPGADGVWALDVVSDTYWHKRQYILPSTTEISIALRPKAFVTGTAASDGEELTEVVIAAQVRSEDLQPEEHVTRCAVAERKYRCALSAGLYDLRLSAPRHIALFFPNVTLAAGETVRMKPVQLRRGQSIVATLTAPSRAALATARLHVQRVNGNREQTATPNSRGVAEVSGVAPGAYVVYATTPAGLTTERVEVTVQDGRDTVLSRILQLDVPVSMSLRITPARGPNQELWTVELTRERGTVRQVETMASSKATEDGEWRSAPVQPDNYILTITSRTGDIWYREEVALHGAGDARDIVLQSRAAHGKVRVGGAGVAAELVFAAATHETVTTTSDAEGKFELVLPKNDARDWNVSVFVRALQIRREVEVRLPEDPEEGITIDLPSASLTGTVVDPTGSPVAGAIVTASGEGAMAYTQVLTAADGGFIVASLADGVYALKATHGEGESTPIHVTIEDDTSPEPVTLKLERNQELRGRIVSAAGPVVGARVQVVPRGVWVPTVFSYTTREDGRFAAKLPPDTREVDLLIAAPGFAFTTARVPYRSEVLTIQIAQIGGTLALAGATQPDVYLVHDGVTMSLRGVLAYEWPTRFEGDVFIAPQMEPGLYRFCGKGNCVEGFLAPDATLRLEVK
jgi:hypothetical protein